MTLFHRLLLCAALSALPAAMFAQQAAAAPAPRPNGLYATIETSLGSVTVELYEKDAPVTVKNFMDLAQGRRAYLDPRNGLPSKMPFFNGLTFHRVIPGFMIQGGDPLGDGTGATKTIPDEFRPELLFDRPGRLAMANAGPNTGSCQFFLTEAEQPHLNQLHTIFGQVVEGQEVVNKIAGVPAENDKPIEPVTIARVRFTRVGPGPSPNQAPSYMAAPPAAARVAPAPAAAPKLPSPAPASAAAAAVKRLPTGK